MVIKQEDGQRAGIGVYPGAFGGKGFRSQSLLSWRQDTSSVRVRNRAAVMARKIGPEIPALLCTGGWRSIFHNTSHPSC